jgi:hypothetical protein
MAQLHVQRKRNQAWWLWIIILLIALAVIYYLLVRNGMVPDSLGIKNYTSSLIDGNKNNLLI